MITTISGTATTPFSTVMLSPQLLELRIKRWEHEAVIDAMQQRLDRAPGTIRIRRQTVEHPFGTLKAWMGATHEKSVLPLKVYGAVDRCALNAPGSDLWR